MNSSKPHAILKLYDKVSYLIEKLPGGLQKPILRELTPIRELYFEHRPPRILLCGSGTQSTPSLLAEMGVTNIHCGKSQLGWRFYGGGFSGAGAMVLDARNDTPDSHLEAGLGFASTDIVLFLHDQKCSSADFRKSLQRALASKSPIIALFAHSDDPMVQQTHQRISEEFGEKLRFACSIDDPGLQEALCASLPPQAQLEYARLANARRAQAYIASSLLKSFGTVCGLIGLQPIPLADLPILASLQSLMVGMIIHTTGRAVTLKLIGEFLGALGFSVGAGFAFREAARAAVRIFPFWGNAVSGFVAGAGTYTIGRAAIAYFIDDSPIQETRRIFLSMLPKRNSSSQTP